MIEIIKFVLISIGIGYLSYPIALKFILPLLKYLRNRRFKITTNSTTNYYHISSSVVQYIIYVVLAGFSGLFGFMIFKLWKLQPAYFGAIIGAVCTVLRWGLAMRRGKKAKGNPIHE